MNECLYLHEPVDSPEEGDVLVWRVDGRQHDEHEDEGGAGDAGGRDGGGRRGEHDGDEGAGVELDVVHLGDEDGSDGDENGGAVHVHGGADREDELGDPLVHVVVVLHAAEGDGQSGSSASQEGRILELKCLEDIINGGARASLGQQQ